jgi:aspartate aminotransferase
MAALNGPLDDLLAMRATFAKRRDAMVAGLNAIPGVTCRTPEGAFYAFPDCRGLYGTPYAGRTIASDEDVAFFFLEQAHVATVPGGPFGAPGYVRFSYATSEERIALGLASIRKAIEAASAAPVKRAAQG